MGYYDGGGDYGDPQGASQQNYGQQPAQNPAVSQIAAAYQQYLGREGTQEEYLSHLGGGRATGAQNVQWALGNIQNSPEAQAYRGRQGTQPTPPASSGGGGGGAAPQAPQAGPSGPAYTAPAMMPSPFITPDGQVPPGMPFTPDMGMRNLQDSILRNAMTTPVMSPEHIARLNEQQKELALTRGQQGQQQFAQSAARRGTISGGTHDAGQRQMRDALTTQLLQSQRDISNQAEITNRAGFLDALGASDSVLGGREDRGLNTARFAEIIRQYNNDLLNRQSEYGAGLQFRYDDLNAGLEQAFISMLLRGGR